MRRFEFSEGTSHKFWEIELSGSEFTVRFGRIGTTGQTQQKSFASDDKAKSEHDKLVAEKVKKGYAEVGGGGATNTVAPNVATAAPSAPKVSKPPAAPKKNGASAPEKATAAPPPVTVAPAQRPAPSTSALPVDDARSIAWDDAYLRRVWPRRGGIAVPVRPPPTPAQAWKAVQHAFAKIRPMLEAGLKEGARASSAPSGLKAKLAAALGAGPRKPPEDSDEAIPDDLAAAALALIQRLDSAEPSPGDLLQDALLILLLETRDTYSDKPRGELAVDLLWPSLGAAHTVSAYLASLDLHIHRRGSPWSPEAPWFPQHGPEEHHAHYSSRRETSGDQRLRELLARAASDDQYREAREAAGGLQPLNPAQTSIRAFIFPTESSWLPPALTPPLLTCISDPKALATAAGSIHAYLIAAAGILPSTLDGVGVEAVSFLSALRGSLLQVSADARREWADALSRIQTEPARTLLFDTLEKECLSFAVDAALRAPNAALRPLATRAAARGKEGDPARAVLTALVRKFPAMIDAHWESLDEDQRRAVLQVRGEGPTDLPDATAEQLPPVLASPPWSQKKGAGALPVVPDVVPPQVADRMEWAPGQQDQWSVTPQWEYRTRYRQFSDKEWKQLEASGKRPAALTGSFFVFAPEALARRWLAEYEGDDYYSAERWMLPLAARWGVEALPIATQLVEKRGIEVLSVLMPYAVAQLAPTLANAYATSKKGRPIAKAWMLAHPEHAAAGLLTLALGPASKAKEAACGALRMLASSGQRDLVLEVASRAKPPVRQAVAEVLDFDPLRRFPSRLPKLPAFFDPAVLPRPLLRDKSAQLPLSAVEALGTMLAFNDPADPYAGLAEVKEACDPASLSRFAWALFEAWMLAESPSKEGWALQALGVFGDDETARRLTPLIREWPGQAAHSRAVAGLDVLATLGTDVTLTYLNSIAEKVKFKGLQEKAREKIEQIAESRGLTREELADRLVPDLGLDDDGSLKLDFGDRTFTVGFDEQLKPYVKDSEGSRLKDLPKPIKKDDPEKAQAAEERWKALKKDAKAVATMQVLRLELGMCGRRRWPASVFRQFFVEHPLLIHVVRRLVWGTYDEGGQLTGTFRVAEDRTFADASDDAWTLPEEAQVGLPHALELDATVAGKWGQLLGDYQLMQPFAQLGRPTFAITPAEKKATALTRVKGVTVATGKVLGLESRGWRRGTPADAGIVNEMEKTLPDGSVIMLELDPGLYTGMLSESPEQTLGEAVVRSPGSWGDDGRKSLSTLDPILFSELVRDLEGLRPSGA